MKNIILIFFFSLPIFLTAQSKDQFLLFYLGGQSNMNGFGYNKDLPAELTKPFDKVWIFSGNPADDNQPNGGDGIWTPLTPGFGAGFTSNGQENKLSNRFGLELTFAQKLQERYPNKKIALIKYAKGGSSIDSLAARHFGSWEPDFKSGQGINQYDHFLATLNNAMSVRDIDGDGKEDELIPTGILWMQGESDGDATEEIAQKYYSNLKRLMDLIRATLRTNNLPIVIGKISDSWNDEKTGKVWDYGEIVQYAQEKFSRTDGNAAIVRQTRYYKYSDPWHYDSDGYIDMGRRFAEAMIKLMKR